MPKHIAIAGEIKIDLNKGLSMQKLYESALSSFPIDPKYTIDGIAIPLIYVECKEFGVIDIVNDIKATMSKLYNYAMQIYFRPIWDLLAELIEQLKHLFDFAIDYKLPILDLSIFDIFKENKVIDAVTKKVTELWATSRDKLEELLKALYIPWPLFDNVENPQRIIDQIIDSIMRSFWTTVLKKISEIIGKIYEALKIWDMLATPISYLAVAWELVKDTVLGAIMDLIINPPTMEEIKELIIEFAKKVYGKAVVTYEEIMAVIKDFKIPILDITPYDWKLPLNPKLSVPDLDFQQLLIDIKTWLNNYVVSIIKDFINAVLDFLRNVFQLPEIILPVLSIPMTFCAIEKT